MELHPQQPTHLQEQKAQGQELHLRIAQFSIYLIFSECNQRGETTYIYNTYGGEKLSAQLAAIVKAYL